MLSDVAGIDDRRDKVLQAYIGVSISRQSLSPTFPFPI